MTMRFHQVGLALGLGAIAHAAYDRILASEAFEPKFTSSQRREHMDLMSSWLLLGAGLLVAVAVLPHGEPEKIP